jgi:hypothetical protein
MPFMTLRKLAAAVPVAAVLAFTAAPAANAQTAPAPSPVTCFPFPAYCNTASGQPAATAPYPYPFLITLFNQLGMSPTGVPAAAGGT